MEPGDLVVELADPLRLGEMIVLSVTPDARLLCEAVHFDAEHEDDPPPRGVFEPHEVELKSVWMRQAA